MSCAMTIDAVKSRTKTVTRRHPDTWMNLRPGDGLTLIEKGMGLAKGSKQVVLAEVVVISNQIETLNQVDEREVQLEGLGHMTPTEFRQFWSRSHGHPELGVRALDLVRCRRIAWSYTIISPEVEQ